jgi:hypothetical protein
MLPLDASDGAGGAGIAGSSEFDTADASILKLRQLSETLIHINHSGGLRSLQEDEATCVDATTPPSCADDQLAVPINN